MPYNPGDDVLVDFCGIEHKGEVVVTSRGWVMCQITIDPLADYGRVTAHLDPQPTVCVPVSRVRRPGG